MGLNTLTEEEDHIIFGIDTKEVVLLRQIANTLGSWRDEADGISLESVFEALDKLKRYQRRRRAN